MSVANGSSLASAYWHIDVLKYSPPLRVLRQAVENHSFGPSLDKDIGRVGLESEAKKGSRGESQEDPKKV